MELHDRLNENLNFLPNSEAAKLVRGIVRKTGCRRNGSG